MPRRARLALRGASVATLLLALTWYASHYVGFVMRADVAILQGFAQLGRPGLDRLTRHIADLCDPHPYVVLAAIPVLVALARRRPRVAAMIALVILGANETTELIKPLLAAPRDPVYWHPIALASWPSGHATAVMSLALCAVVSAPARWRPAVAAAMAGFAIAVVYSFLELGWHYPSDVFGGFLVAATWTLLGVAGLSIYEQRRPAVQAAAGEAPAPLSLGQALTPACAMLAVGALCTGLILVARPHEVVAYAENHHLFVFGAAAIGALSVILASGLSLILRRG
jgi:membrane-associated phospholipid phosphatase